MFIHSSLTLVFLVLHIHQQLQLRTFLRNSLCLKMIVVLSLLVGGAISVSKCNLQGSRLFQISMLPHQKWYPHSSEKNEIYIIHLKVLLWFLSSASKPTTQMPTEMPKTLG